MALNATPGQLGAAAADGLLSVHRFDAASGVIGEALAEMHGADAALVNMEICTFLPSISGTPYRILVADQGADVVTSSHSIPRRGRWPSPASSRPACPFPMAWTRAPTAGSSR